MLGRLSIGLAVIALLMAFSAVAPSAGPAEATCSVNVGPKQWTSGVGGNNHWYQLICAEVSWTTAQANAVAEGKYLATLTSAAENTFIGASPDLTPSSCNCNFWIGGFQDPNQALPGDNWHWVTSEPFGSYTNWVSPEPNDASTPGENNEENYMEVTSSTQWRDQDLTDTQNDAYIVEWADDDNDTIPDGIDNCLGVANPNQEDTDLDGVGDACDNCPDNPNLDQANNDGDSFGDACDNCPTTTNENQSDVDNDDIGDLCDSEDDIVSCTDGLDNDGDGLTDEDDEDCEAFDPNITVEKAFNGNLLQVFQFLFNTDGPGCLFSIDGGPVTMLEDGEIFGLIPGQVASLTCPDGAHTITEILSGDFDFVSLVCGGEAFSDVTDNSVLIRSPGEDLADCLFTNEIDDDVVLHELVITKVCPNGDGDADFNILVTQLGVAVPGGTDALACNEVMVVPDLTVGTYSIQELITGPNAGDFTTQIICTTAGGQTVTPGQVASTTVGDTQDTSCLVINVFEDPGAEEPEPPAPCNCVIVPIDIDNTNTNTLNNDNINDNNNENTNTQEQSNEQTQTNDNNQTTTVNSSPSVVIDFD